MSSTEEQLLAELHRRILICPLCHLSKTRNNAVPGEGPFNPQIMFIGEGPGRQEDIQGRPFVGRAGQFLEECLTSIGLRREEVFITNVVKCRPIERQGNVLKDRKPSEEEIAVCSPYLEKQIGILNPKIICTLGDTAKSYVFKRFGLKDNPISRIHGSVYSLGQRRIVVMYHPAAALYDFKLKDVILNDFRKIKDLMEQA